MAAGKKAVVSGFTDATGDPAKNAELAKQRAFAVRDALKAAGVAEDKIELKKPEQLTGSGEPPRPGAGRGRGCSSPSAPVAGGESCAGRPACEHRFAGSGGVPETGSRPLALLEYSRPVGVTGLSKGLSFAACGRGQVSRPMTTTQEREQIEKESARSS